MTLHDQFRTALANVGRRKLRSALASLGVVVGVVTIVVLVSLASGVRRQINNQFASMGLDRLVVDSGGWRGGGGRNPFGFGGQRKLITPQEIAKWKAIPGVKKVSPEVNLPSGVQLELAWNGTNQPVRTGSMRFGPGLFEEVPQPLAGSLELSDAGGIVVSLGTVEVAGIPTNDFARILGQNVEVILRTSRGEKQSFNLRVQGISREHIQTVRVSVNDCVAMKNWWFNSTTNLLDRDGYNSVTIRTEDVSRANAISAQLRNDGFQVQSIEAFMSRANQIVSVITLMFTLVGSIALLVAAIGIANTMVMATYERTREIGILKAMGASSREIGRIFMLEAGFIGMMGGISGVVLGWLLSLVLNPAAQAYARFRDLPPQGQLFLITPILVIGAISFATVIGLVAGLLPARRAAKLNPLDALRHE